MESIIFSVLQIILMLFQTITLPVMQPLYSYQSHKYNATCNIQNQGKMNVVSMFVKSEFLNGTSAYEKAISVPMLTKKLMKCLLDVNKTSI